MLGAPYHTSHVHLPYYPCALPILAMCTSHTCQVRITKEAMEKLGDITIFVLDYDPNGADNLGFYKLGLNQAGYISLALATPP